MGSRRPDPRRGSIGHIGTRVYEEANATVEDIPQRAGGGDEQSSLSEPNGGVRHIKPNAFSNRDSFVLASKKSMPFYGFRIDR